MQWWTTETIFSMIFKLSNHFQPIPINNRRRGSQDNLEAFLLLTTNPHTVQKQPASNYHQRGHHQTKSLTSPQGNNHKRTAKTPYGYIIMKVPAHRLKNTTKELVPEYIEILEFDPEEIPLQTSRHRAWRWLCTEDLRKLAKEKSRLWPYEGYEPILTSERVDALKKKGVTTSDTKWTPARMGNLHGYVAIYTSLLLCRITVALENSCKMLVR